MASRDHGTKARRDEGTKERRERRATKFLAAGEYARAYHVADCPLPRAYGAFEVPRLRDQLERSISALRRGE